MVIDLHEKLEKNFSLHEFLWLPQWKVHVFPSKSQYENIKHLAKKLQGIRNMYNRRVFIMSGLRPELYNQLIGGSAFSSHRIGGAGDFIIDGMDSDGVRLELKDKLIEMKVRMEDSPTRHIHMDISIPLEGGNYYFKP